MNQDLGNRVRRLRLKSGLSQSELARRIGIKPQAVQALERGIVKRPRYIVPLAMELSVSPQYLESGVEEAAPDIRRVMIRGHVQAGEWAEASEWDPDDWYEVAVPNDAEFSRLELYGVEARGPSMNRRYPEGTALIYVNAHDDEVALVPGKRYIIERRRADGMHEATVKSLWKDDTGSLWLLPESTDPLFQQPIPVDGSEGDEVRVLGRVVYSVSKE